ncbi:hypothetical protein [Candidatus Borrarchaeum sp.]|uniref:hypothetical protein n=1 Tax=Candidatus Borrarchaeum sp. TaxID=2846742 RepID=UPI00257B1C44|nr:hypothetical protein [Candidatus Borrarchaeum sp.]
MKKISTKNMWNAIPLRNLILNAVSKRQGVILDTDLVTLVQRADKNSSLDRINKELMRLEIEGIIHVSQITKTKRRVEIIKDKQLVTIAED